LGNAGALNSLRPNAVTVGSAGVLSLNNTSATVSGLSAPVAGAVVQNGGTTSNAVLTARIGAANAFAGVIKDGASSTLGLTVVPTAAAGILTLTGVNSYTGPTVLGGPGGVAGGGLTLNSTGQLTGTSGITLSGGTLTLTNTNVVEGAIDRVNNAAGITSNGGAITYTNTAGAGNSYAETLGALTLSSGRLTVTSTNATTSPATQALTFSNGTGLASRAAANTSTVAFLGGTTLGTTLQNQIFITGQAATSAGVPIGAWATAGVGTTAVDYAAYGSTFGVTPLNATSTGTSDTTWNTSYSNDATGNINFGSGTTTTTLTASRVLNTLRYSGGAATLALAGNSLTTQGVLQGGSGLLTITSTGGTITSGGNPDYNLYVTLGAAQGITVTSGNITNNGSNPVTLVLSAGAAASTLTLTPTTNTYTGGTVINSGTLSIAGDGGLGSSGGLTFNGSGGLTFATNAVTVGSGRTVTLNNGSRATITLSNVAGNTIAGRITGTGGLTVTAGGTTGTTLALTATNNDFTGPIQIGTSTQATGLTVSSLVDAASPGTGDISFGSTTGSGTLTWASTATGPLTLNNRSIALAGTTGGGVIDNSNATAANAITINPDLIVTGSGAKTLTLQGANTGANAFAGAINDGAGSVISVSKGGAGNWTLSSTNNTATGNLNVAVGTSGTLTFASWGSGTGGVTTSGTAAALTGTLRYTGSAPLNMSGAVSLSSQTTGTLTLDSSGSGAWNLSNTSAIAVGGGSKTLALAGTNSGDNTLAGLVQNNSGTNTTALTKSGAGKWILTNANTHSGLTTVSNGTLQLGNAFAVQNSGVAVGVNNGLAFSSGITNFTLGNLSGAGNLAMTDTAAAAVNLTVGGNNAATSTFSGNLSGAGNFIKVGTGTLTLSGTGSSNSGTVTVDGGTLSANPSAISSATGTITVGSTATGSVLDLYADNAAASTNLVGGVNLVLGGGTGQSGALGFNLGASGTGDQLVFSGGGSLTIASGGIGLINASALSGFNAGTWTLVSGGTANSTSFVLGNMPTGFGYSLTQDSSSLSLTATTASATMWWKGDIGGSWNTASSGGAATNWDTDSSSGIDAAATPGTGTTVNFSATGAGNFTSTLDAAFSIAGLNVTNNEASAVTINAGTGGTLTLGTGGINVQTGAPTPLTIGAPVAVGASQDWTVADASSVLSVSGIVSGGAGNVLGKTGPGQLTLTGANTFTGGLAIKQGTVLATTSANALGANANVVTLGDSAGGSNAATLLAGSALTYAQPITLAANTTGTLTIGNTGTGINAIFSGAVTGSNNVVIQNGAGTGTLTFSASTAFNHAGTLTHIDSGGATGGLTISGIIGTNVGQVIQNSATSSLTLGAVANTWTGGLVIKAGNVIGGSNANTFGGNSNVITLGDTSGSANATLTPFNSATYPQAINVAAGNTGVATLMLGTTTGSVVWGGAITLNNNLTIAKSGSTGATQVTGGITGTGNVVLNNTGTTGTITLATGAINNIGTITNSGAPDVGTITTISANIGSNVTGVIQNSATSPLALSGSNASFGGGVTLTQGTLNLNSATAPGTGTLSISGGTTINNSSAGALVISTNPAQVWDGDYTFTGTRSLDLGSGAVSLGTAAGTARQITVSANTLTVGGVISDGTTATGLTKAGAGSLVLGGTNTYSGTTTINAGTLSIATSANLGNASATNTLAFGGGTLAFTGGTVDLGANRAVALNTGGGTFNVTGTRLTVSGAVSGANALTKSGAGTLVLSSTGSTNNGTITVNGGTLSVHPSAIAAATGIIVGSTVTGSVLDLYADNAAATTNLAGGTNLTLGGSGGLTGALGFNLGASGTGDQLVFSGGGSLLIGSGGVGLINASAISGFGAGTWTLVSGGTANATNFGLGALPGGFTYSLTQSATSLSLTAAAAAAGNVFWAGDLGGSWSTLTGGGTSSNWSTSAGAITPDFAATPGSANTVNFSSTGAANFSTTLDNAFSIAGLVFTNVGSAVTIAPGTGGTLQIGSGGIAVNTGAPTGSAISAPVILGANNTWTVTDAATTLTVSGAVSETGGVRTLAKAGAGTLVLSGANSYGGLTTVSAGVLRAANNSALGTGGVTLSASGAVLELANGVSITNTPLTFASATGARTLRLQDGAVSATFGGNIVLTETTNTDSDISVPGGGTLTLTGVISSVGFEKVGPGTLVLAGSADNTYTGATSVSNGVLNLRHSGALGTTAGSTTVGTSGAALELQGGITIGAEALSIRGFGPANSGALRNISGTNTWGGAITQAAASRINSDAGTLILDVSTGNAVTGTFGLTLGGAGNGEVRDPIATSTGTLTKDGTGTWSLRPSAVNTYTGATNVNGGTLLLDFVNATPATNLINVASILNLGGGTLSLLGKATTINSQTFASTGLTAGTYSNVAVDKQTATSLTLAMGTLTRNANSGVNFDLTNSPTVTLTLGATLSNATGIITAVSSGAAVATFNKTDWATMSGSNPIAYTGYVTDTFTTSTNNIDVTTSGAWAGTSLNTLRFNTGAPTLTLTGVNTLDAGGILIGSGAGAVVIGGTGTLAGADATGTTATPVAGELGVFQHSATAATISAPIVNNALGLSHVAATPSGTLFNKYGTGTLILSSTRNAWTGGTNIGAGILQLGAANVIPDGVGNPGLFSISRSGTLNMNGFSETINGLSGSGIVDNTSASPVTLTVGNGTLAGSVTSTFSGNILNSGGGALSLLKVGTGTLTLTGSNTYSGSTTVNQGNLTLSFATAGAPVSNILPATTSLTLGSGTLTSSGVTAATPINSTQAFSGTTLSGGGTITLNGTTSGLNSLALGAITRNAGSTLVVNLLNAFNTVTTTTANTGTSILGGWAVQGATVPNTWAVSAGTGTAAGAITGLAAGSYLTTTTAGNTAANYLTTSDVDVTSSPTLGGAITINSLRFNTSGANTVTLTGTNTINTGGILVTGTVGSNNQVITGGTLRGSASGELIIHNYNTNTNRTITIESIIADNVGATGLTINGTTGSVNLRVATNTYTGQTVINGGSLNVDAAGRISTSSGLTLNGGTLVFGADASQPLRLTLGAAGGTINVSGAGSTARDVLGGGNVLFAGTGPGPRTLTINGGTTSRIWNLNRVLGDSAVDSPSNFTLNTSGTGTGVNPDAMIFSMTAANTYTGTTTINRGILRMGVANAISSGTGGLTSAATTGNILFNATTTTRAILETNATAGTITRSLGYGPGQIHWEGNGGFSNSSAATQIVNLGGAGATATWGAGGFVPTGSLLQFGSTAGNNNQNLGAINFVNAIELGTAARTIDVGTANLTANGGLAAILSGNLTSGTGGGIVKSGIGTLLLTGNNTGGPATVNVSGGSLIFEDLAAIPGTGANITLSTTAANNAAIGMLGDTNPITTFGARLANPTTATAAFLLGADSSATLDFTGYTNMRLGAYSVRTPTTTPTVPVNAVTFTGSITPAGGTYRLGGQGTSITNTQAIGTLVLGAKNQLTGTNLVNISSGGVTITATNNVSGATTLTNNGIEASILGIGSKAALGTSTITFVGGNTFRWGPVNGDQSVSNNIAWDPASTANWAPTGDAANDGILRNTSQGAMTYLGTINLAGRSNPTLTFRPGAGLFLGDFTGAATGFTYGQTAGGYLSMLSTSANGGVAKTYSGTTVLGDEAILVIDSENSLGTSGNIGMNSSAIVLQPGTTAVTLARNFANNGPDNPGFNTSDGSTLTLTGTFSGSTTGIFVKQGDGTLIMLGDATGAVVGSTTAQQLRSGTWILDAATRGASVWTPNIPLSIGAISATTYSTGATLQITGAFAQSFGAVTVQRSANNINLTGAMTLTLGSITRTQGSTLNFSVPFGTVASATAGIAGLVNGATTWNGNDWASANGTNVGQFTAYDALTGTLSAPTITTNAAFNYILDNNTTNNVTLAAAGTLAAPNNANTLKYSDASARVVDLGSGFFRLGTGGAAAGGVTNAGGVLVASGAGALTIQSGQLMAGGTTTNTLGDLVFINNSASDITVSSAIVNNGGTTGATQVVYDGRSTGKLILSGANTFTGAITINKGVLEVATVNNGAAAGPLGQATAGAANILLTGGTFRANLGTDGATDRGFTVQGRSTIDVVANTLTINSTVIGVPTERYHYSALNAGILRKTGAGTLELKDLAVNANNANLSVEVVAGTLLLNKTTTSAISAVDLAGGAALIIDSVGVGSAPTVRISGTGGNQISDASSVVVNGGAVNGVLDLNGLSETIDGLAGSGTVTTGIAGTATLSVGGNNSANISPYTLAAAAAGMNATGLNNFSGTLSDGSGTLALTKVGSGTQILSSAQSYSGATTISAGTLQLGVANALPNGAGKANVTIVGNNTGVAIGGSGLILAPGTLDMGGFDQAINGLDSTTGGFVTNNPTLAYNGSAWAVAALRQGTKTLTLGNSIPTNASFNGVIQDGFSVEPGVTATGYIGAINLVKLGSNSQTLSGANTYSGSTAIRNGSVILTGGTNRLPATTAVTLGNGTDSGVLQIGGGSTVTQTLAGLLTSGTGTGNKVVGGNAANSTLILNQTGSATYAGGLGGAGTNENNLNFTLQGGGTLTVAGTNTLSGTTTIQGGSTLVLGSDYAGAIVVGGTGSGTLSGTGFTVSGLTTVTSNGTIAPGASALASATGTLTFANGLTLSGGTLAFGLGTSNDLINLSGGSFNVTTGSFISLAEVGTLSLGTYDLLDYSFNPAALTLAGWNNLSLINNVIGANNYVASLVPYNTVPGKLQVLIDNARFWSAQTNGVWDVNSTANWTPGLRYLEGDKVIFGDTFPPGTAPGTTSVTLNTTVTPGAMTFQNASLTYSFDGSGAISGMGSISKSGAGAVIMSLNNSAFTGSTGISAGSIEMRHANALGSGNLSVTGTGELRLSGGIAVGANALSLNGTGTANGGALRNLSGDNSFAGAVTLGGATRINSDAGLLTLSGGITGNANNLVFGGAGNIAASGVLSGSGTLTVDGTGVVALSNTANTYTGQTFIQSGTLSVNTIGSVGTNGGLGNAPDAATGTIAIGSGTSSGTLKWTGSGSANETTDRVIDLAGTTGGATIDASGTGGYILNLSSGITATGSGAKTLTLSGTGGTSGTPNIISAGIADGPSAAVSLVKTGSGSWRLDASNSYSGSTEVNGGNLILGVANALPSTAVPVIGNGSGAATLDLNSLDQTFGGLTFGGSAATGTAQGNLALGSAGTLTLNGNVTYDATGNPLGATISGTGTSNLDLNAAARTFTVGASSNSGGADLTISAVIADAATGGSLVKAGAGNLVLTGANTYTGATTVDGGTLSVSPAALATTSAINVGANGTPGVFALYADNSATGVTLPADTNLSVGSATSLGYLGFDLSGASSADTITLSGSGGLTIGAAGGVINARALSALIGSSYLLLDRNAATSIPINTNNGFYLGALPGGYSYGLDNTTDVGKLYLTVGTAAAGPYYWTGARSTDSWAELGSGGTTSNWATNQAGTIDAGATPGNITVIFSADNAGAAAINTTLDQAYSIAGLQFIGNPSATGNVSIAPGAGMGTLTLGSGGIDIQTGASSTNTTISAPVILGANQSWGVTDSGQTLTVSGAVSGSSNLTKTGAGLLVLSGANTGFSGSVAVNGGTVSIGASGNLGDGSATNTLSLAGGTLRNSGSSVTLGTNRTVALGIGGGTFDVTSSNILTVDGVVSGSTNLTKTGTGTLVLSGANSGFSGAVAINAGTLSISSSSNLGDASATNTLSLAGGTLRNTGASVTLGTNRTVAFGSGGGTFEVTSGNSLTVNGTLSGSTSLAKTGAGVLVLSGANTGFSGAVAINAGTVRISAANNLGDGSAGNTLTLNDATLNGTASFSDSRNYLIGHANSTLTANAGTVYTIANAATTSVGGTGTLNLNGPGVVVLDDSLNPNTFSGGSVLSGLGTVRINTATSLGDASGAVTLKDATLQVTADVTSARNFTLASYGATISVDSTRTYSLGGLLSDGSPIGTLNKTGTGIFSLTRAAGNTYSGGTFVTAGTLLANNTSGSATGTGAVSVTGTDSTLGGSGFITGAVTIGGSGAVLSPGTATAAGTLTLGGLTLSSGSVLNYQLGAP
ncbi:beta strand repeat-containing protein, partial [Hyphomonas sp.]|uniref:beta strand repeat-containing protein n=1 Tax=Hyphomonas sp. TaxID=87 RepID=UPI0037BF5DA8